MIFGILHHVTVLAIVGFFVLFAATRVTGGLQTFGKILGYWVLLLAILAVVGGIAGRMGYHPFGMGMMHRPGMMQGGGMMMRGGQHPGSGMMAPAPAAPEAAPPAAPSSSGGQ